MSSTFKKKKEDFECEQCGATVIGDGYTNHCTECLYSKHVDIHPGDREATCGGLMKPIAIEKKGDNIVITHRCEKCDHTKKNKWQKNDNAGAMYSVLE